MTRTERDRPAALAASEASQAKAKLENAQAGHTPGPWHAERTGPWDGWDGWEVVAKDGATVCNGLGYQRDPIREANARLIAAAPELLEALKNLDEAYCRSGGPLTRAERHEDRQRLIAARAAIKKALGDTE